MSLIELLGFGVKGWGGVLVAAALMTVAVTLCALLIGAVIGALIAWARLSGNLAAGMLGIAYTTLLRGVPELLIIYIVYFGGSAIATAIGALLGGEGFMGLPTFVAGALAVGVISAAYQAEVYRGAFLSVGKGEIEAARAFGMAPLLRFRRIIIPQVLRFALPGLGNVWQMSLKDSALISVTGLAELMRETQVAAGSTHQYFVFYVAGGALYLIMTSLSNQVFSAAESRVAKTFRTTAGRR
jgi:octopine/nopaline transport system permease protein